MESTIRKRRTLPHLESPNAIYFVTYRLADSLPPTAIPVAYLEIPTDTNKELSLSKRTEKLLDNSAGECHLTKPEIAATIAESLKHFEGVRYHLQAWCIMPNHIHVVVQPREEWKLEKVVHTWKSYTANQANRALNRTGEFWQREYYDHVVRDNEDLDRITRYVFENPKKANLKNWPYVWIRETSP
jgi:REP element-mobilizing transposase RayT